MFLYFLLKRKLNNQFLFNNAMLHWCCHWFFNIFNFFIEYIEKIFVSYYGNLSNKSYLRKFFTILNLKFLSGEGELIIFIS